MQSQVLKKSNNFGYAFYMFRFKPKYKSFNERNTFRDDPWGTLAFIALIVAGLVVIFLSK